MLWHTWSEISLRGLSETCLLTPNINKPRPQQIDTKHTDSNLLMLTSPPASYKDADLPVWLPLYRRPNGLESPHRDAIGVEGKSEEQ